MGRTLFSRTLSLCAVSALAMIAGTASAHAQSPQPTQTGEPPADTGQANSRTDASDATQDIIVTAQFRSQNLQDTPIAITATTAEMLEARSQSTIIDVANRAPSVTLYSGGRQSGAQVTTANIRGIGQTDFNLAIEPGVGIYIDDVYYGISYGSTFELLDLDRVEILRGPQGTLSGKNSEGGAIKLFSKKPDGDTSGYIEGIYGSFNRLNLRAGFNFAIVPDKLFLRVSGIAEQRDGYVTRYDYECVNGKKPAPVAAASQITRPGSCVLGTEGGKSILGLRAALRWVISDAVENTTTVDYTADRSEPSPTVLLYQGAWNGPGYDLRTTPPTPNTPENFVFPHGSYSSYANYTALIGIPAQYTLTPRSDAFPWGISNVLDVDLSDSVSLKSITALRKLKTNATADGDASPLNRFMQTWAVNHRAFSQELRLSAKFGNLIDGTVGLYYYDAKSLQAARIGIDGASSALPYYVPVDFIETDPVRVKSKSAFAHVALHPFEGLDLTAGLRYTDDRKTITFNRSLAPGVPLTVVNQSLLSIDGSSGEFKGSRWDYRFSANYRISPEVNIYGQIATGFKGGGINPRAFYPIQVRPFDPEVVTTYEVGLKTDLFNRRLRFNAAAFINKFSDIQLTIFSCPEFVPPGASPNCSMPANVGDATVKGIELETEFRPVTGMLIDGSLSYINFQYDRIDPVARIDLSMKPPYTPEWKASAGIQYEIDAGNIGRFTPRLDYQYISSQFADAINNPRGTVPGYSLFNARLTYAHPGNQWEASFAVTNLFDKYYFLNIYNQAPPVNAAYNTVTGQPGRPREWSLSLKYKF